MDEESIDRFILDSGFFYNLVNHLKESIINIVRSTAASKTLGKLDIIIEEVVDLLYHFNDIFDIGREIFNRKLSDVLLKALILPILISSITENKLKPYHLPIPVSIYILSKFLYILNYPPLVRTLVFLMFSPNLPKSYYEVIINPPNRDSPYLEESEEIVKNPLNASVMSFLCCKEDNLLGLSMSLVQSALLNAMDIFLNCPNPESSQEKYTQFVSLIGNVLMAEEELRFFTCYLASKLLFELSGKAFYTSLRLEKEIIANALYKKAGTVLNSLNNFFDPILFIRIFEEEWDFVKELCWDERLELPLNYILPSVDERLMQIPLENRRPFGDDDLARYEIRLFLLYRKLNYLIFPSEIPEGIDYNSCPLKALSTHFLEVGNSYHLNAGHLKGKSTTKTIVKGLTNSVRFIVDDPNFFILSQKSNDGSSLVIEYLVRYSRIQIQDRQEPNVMMVHIEQKTQLVLTFENFSVWITLKNKIEKRIRDCKENDVMLLRGFIQDTK